MKTCSVCKLQKDKTDFYAHKSGREGLCSDCKPCHKAAVRRWQLANGDLVRASQLKYVRRNPEKLRIKNAKYRAKNRPKIKEVANKWCLNNPEKVRAKAAKWEKNNRGKRNALFMRHHASKINATPAWANRFFIEEIYDLAARRTAIKCGGIAKWHVDHIVPLQSNRVCGLHVEHNLQVIPAAMNASKKNRYWPDMVTS